MLLNVAAVSHEVFSNTDVLNNIIVAGIVTSIMNIVKHYFDNMPKVWYPVWVFLLAGVVNLANYWLFVGLDNNLWKVALREGLILGAMASGIYGMGKGALTERTLKKQDKKAVEDTVNEALDNSLKEVSNCSDSDINVMKENIKKEMIKRIKINRI